MFDLPDREAALFVLDRIVRRHAGDVVVVQESGLTVDVPFFRLAEIRDLVPLDEIPSAVFLGCGPDAEVVSILDDWRLHGSDIGGIRMVIATGEAFDG